MNLWWNVTIRIQEIDDIWMRSPGENGTRSCVFWTKNAVNLVRNGICLRKEELQLLVEGVCLSSGSSGPWRIYTERSTALRRKTRIWKGWSKNCSKKQIISFMAYFFSTFLKPVYKHVVLGEKIKRYRFHSEIKQYEKNQKCASALAEKDLEQ